MPDPIYAIGDIHGQITMLEDALERIDADGGSNARIVFLGDYVDRGPDSRGVLECLTNGRSQGYKWILLKGNHDRMFQWFMEDPPRHDPYLFAGYHWFHNVIGGEQTMKSYGITVSKSLRQSIIHDQASIAVPQSHLNLIRSLDLSFETENFFFVHAGIRPKVPFCKQIDDDLLWIRNDFTRYTARHPKIIVHGHTAIKRAKHYGNRINVDSGAGYGRSLSVIVLDGLDCYTLTRRGRLKLNPKIHA